MSAPILIQSNKLHPVTIREVVCSSTRKFEKQSATIDLSFLPKSEFRIAPTASQKELFSLGKGAEVVTEINSEPEHSGERSDNCFVHYMFRVSDGTFQFNKIQFFTDEMECWVGLLADETLIDHSDYFRKQLEGEESC